MTPRHTHIPGSKQARKRFIPKIDLRPGPSKYRAKAVTVDGHRFPSRLEAARYGELKLLERAGEISGLTLQPEYPLVINGKNCGKYIADFRFVQNGSGVRIEDVKGFATPVYKLKRKIVEALYGITVTEVTARGRR